MNFEEKFRTLLANPQVCNNIHMIDFLRLLEGDLWVIGDALIAGDTILFDGKKYVGMNFSVSADRYTIAQKTIKINGIEVNAPWGKDEIKRTNAYWLLALDLEDGVDICWWFDKPLDICAMDRGQCWKSKED